MDDLKHFFFECEDVAPIWTSILSTVKEKYHLSDLITEYSSVILGCVSAPPIVNLILLLTKQHIVSCKLAVDPRQPNLEQLWSYIKSFALAELMIAKKRNKIDQHNKKWGTFLNDQGFSEIEGES